MEAVIVSQKTQNLNGTYGEQEALEYFNTLQKLAFLKDPKKYLQQINLVLYISHKSFGFGEIIYGDNIEYKINSMSKFMSLREYLICN